MEQSRLCKPEKLNFIKNYKKTEKRLNTIYEKLNDKLSDINKNV
ncbi:hypothetical protein ACSSV5_002479 [Psychroflexus sp. MBR-150]|jgi:hypothetical protein